MLKNKRILVAVAMLLISATLLSTASYAWFAMNTRTSANGLQVGAYSDSLFLQIKAEDGTYNTEVNYTADPSYLRLTTASLNAGFEYVTFTTQPTAATGAYDSSKTYYVEDGNNWIVADTSALNAAASSTADMYKDPTFERVVTDALVTGTFYSYDAPEDLYVIEEVTIGKSMLGWYRLTSNVEASGETYDGSSAYYQVDGRYLVNVTHTLHAADSVDGLGYYTIDTAPTSVNATTTEGDDTTVYYIKNTKANGKVEYTYVGTVPTGVRLDQHLFWGKAYSTSHSNAQVDNTITLVPENRYETLDDYRLATTMYIRLAEDSNDAMNLRVANIKIGGANNPLKGALRVLIVATSSTNTTKNVAYMLYDAGTGDMVHNNGVGGNSNLFDKVLGNADEEITVQVYIYFDGTDDLSKNSTLSGGTLNGQTVDIEFAIDDHNYNS